MTLDPSKYVLPPPLGVGNDMYEPFPQAPDTPFSDSKNPIAGDTLPTTRFTVYGNSPPASDTSKTTPSGSWSDTFKNLFTSGGKSASIFDLLFGSGVANDIGASVSNYFVRFIVVVLGFVFVAVGLSMLGAHTPVGQTVLRNLPR